MKILRGSWAQARWEATGMLASVRKKGVSFLREIFGEVILVISGRAAGCTKALSQRSEGAIFSKRSKPQGTDRSPHDASTIIAGGLK
jgi:hypothetical protein